MGDSLEAGCAVAAQSSRAGPAASARPSLQPGAGGAGAATAMGMGQLRPHHQPTPGDQERHDRTVCMRQLFPLPSQSFAM